MALRRRQRLYAFVLSVLGHAGIVGALMFSIPLSSRQTPAAGGVVVPIEAVMINESAIEAEMARLQAAEEAERIRLQEEAEALLQQRAAEQQELARIQAEREEAERVAEAERVERDRRANEERLRLERIEEQRIEAERLAEQERIERERREEAERLAEQQRQREEAERQRLEAERLEAERLAAAQRQAVEADIERAMAAERAAQEARDAGLRADWARAISDKVDRNWNKPPSVRLGLECVLVVSQLPNGEVTQVVVADCNTSDQTIVRSLENAVLNASPLPERPPGVPFERQVRIRFIPTE